MPTGKLPVPDSSKHTTAGVCCLITIDHRGDGRPYTTAGDKNSQVRVQRVDNPGVTETRLWGSYEKVTVIRRSTADAGKR
jgi:hypothetical protein